MQILKCKAEQRETAFTMGMHGSSPGGYCSVDRLLAAVLSLLMKSSADTVKQFLKWWNQVHANSRFICASDQSAFKQIFTSRDDFSTFL